MQRHRLTLLALSAPVAFSIVAGSSSAQQPAPTPTPTNEVAIELFARDCANCHGSQAEGTDLGPSLAGVGAASAHFYLSTGRMPLPSPAAEVRRRSVAYSEDELDALVTYIASLGVGPEIPPVDPSEGSLVDGMRLYTQNCSACHSSAGIGGALTSGIEAPSLRETTPTQVAEAMLIGPGNMPVFGPATFDDHQVDSIVRYVNSLADLEGRGGSPLGNVGPIAEGLIAWLVGLGALILVVMFIEGLSLG